MSRLAVQKSLVAEYVRENLPALLASPRISFLLALGSFLFILLYVFVLSPYENFLYNDMLDFWRRALSRLTEDPFQETQFLAWPPGYHIFIAEVLRLLRALGIEYPFYFEIFLGINIAVYALSVFALHRMAIKWFNGDARLSLAAALLYGFGFPAWFFNAFLLSDNLAAPLVVIACSLVYLKSGFRYLVIAALLLAFASFVRPSVAPYGLAFVLMMLAVHRISIKFIIRAGVFSVVFFAAVFLGMAEISRISKGKVSGLSANGGLDFFIANSRIHRIDLNYDGWHNFVIVPALSWKPENGFYKTEVPYYQQDHYYRLGWEFIKRNPERLVKNIEHVKDLFFASMLPSRTDAPGFTLFRPVWDWLKFFCFLTAFFLIWFWRDFAPHEKKLATFMLSVIGITFIVSYVYTGEPRYTYSVMFVFYLLALKVLQLVLTRRERARYALPRVAILLVGLWLSGKVLAFMVTPSYPDHIHARFAGQTSRDSSQPFQLDRLYFPHVKKRALTSADKNMKLRSAGELKFATDLHLAGEARNIKLDIQSAWPIIIKVDDRIYFRATAPDFFRETVAVVPLTPGKHRVEITVNYRPGEGGLAVSYNYMENDGWVYRDFMGVDKGPISFSLPKEQ